ncbi:MAG: hypothetical protein AB7O93_07230 [Vicinamibacterales bacterium]
MDRQALVCGHCGVPADVALPADAAVVVPHDLAAAPAEMAHGGRTAVRCEACNAVSLLAEGRVGQRCEFCGSPSLVPYAVHTAIAPDSVWPFGIGEAQALEAVKAWHRERVYTAARFLKTVRTDTVIGVYVPVWHLAARGRATWFAEVLDKSTRKQGTIEAWDRTERELPLELDTLDVAATGVDAARLKELAPFPEQMRRAFHAGFLAGWIVEHAQIDFAKAQAAARAALERAAEACCREDLRRETYRYLAVATDFDSQTYTYDLLPVWIVSSTYRDRTDRVLVNGVTGAVAGTYAQSGVKMAVGYAVILAVIGLLAWGLYTLLRPLAGLIRPL